MKLKEKTVFVKSSAQCKNLTDYITQFSLVHQYGIATIMSMLTKVLQESKLSNIHCSNKKLSKRVMKTSIKARKRVIAY